MKDPTSTTETSEQTRFFSFPAAHETEPQKHFWLPLQGASNTANHLKLVYSVNFARSVLVDLYVPNVKNIDIFHRENILAVTSSNKLVQYVK